MKLLPSKVAIARVLITAALASTAFAFWPRTPAKAFYFSVTLRSSLAGFAQLYYDAGSGINESDSVRVAIAGGNREAECKFPLPDGAYARLRFDPTDRAGNAMTLSNARIMDKTGSVVRTIGPD